MRELRGEETLGSFAKKIGVSAPAVQNYERGRIPDAEVLMRVAWEFKKTIPWLLTGKELFEEEGLDKEARENAEIGGQELARVGILEDRVVAGLGGVLDIKKIAEWEEVPAKRLHRRHEYRFIKVTGESMEPILHPGDLLLVNFSRRDPRTLKDRAVLAYIRDEDMATVKVLEEDSTGKFWMLRALNPLHGVRVIPKKEDGFEVAAIEGVWLGNGK